MHYYATFRDLHCVYPLFNSLSLSLPLTFSPSLSPSPSLPLPSPLSPHLHPLNRKELLLRLPKQESQFSGDTLRAVHVVSRQRCYLSSLDTYYSHCPPLGQKEYTGTEHTRLSPGSESLQVSSTYSTYIVYVALVLCGSACIIYIYA